MRFAWLVLVAACGSNTPTPAPAPLTNAQPVADAPPPPKGKLAITGIEPAIGDRDGGTYVRITGRGFLSDGPINAKLYFGNHQGTVVRFASDSELIAQAPGGKDGDTVDLLVIFEGKGELKLPHAFTFVEAHHGGP